MCRTLSPVRARVGRRRRPHLLATTHPLSLLGALDAAARPRLAGLPGTCRLRADDGVAGRQLGGYDAPPHPLRP